MPSVREAESWSSWVWAWEETDDGDIATASMGKQGGSAPSPVAKIDSSSQHQEQQNPSPQPCWGTKTPQESRELLKEEEETTKPQSLGLAAVAHL
jgi:hypothetical protein